jgi:hypothetical protein
MEKQSSKNPRKAVFNATEKIPSVGIPKVKAEKSDIHKIKWT